MKRVIVESPFAGNLFQCWRNRRYARACLRDALLRGEAPLASHLLYTQPGILRDHDPAERKWGIAAGLSWLPAADASVVYVDRGLSAGMRAGIAAARQLGIPIEARSLRRGNKAARALARLIADGAPDVVHVPDEAAWHALPDFFGSRANAARQPIRALANDALACADDHCRNMQRAYDALARKGRRENGGAPL